MTFLPTDLGGGVPSLPTPQQQQSYGKTYDFDFEAGEFVEAGDVVVVLDLTDSLAQALEKQLVTERHRWLAYTGNYGSDVAPVLRNPITVGTTTEAAVENVATEVLKHDRRVARVDNLDATVIGAGPWTVQVEADIVDTFGVTTPLDVTMTIDV